MKAILRDGRGPTIYHAFPRHWSLGAVGGPLYDTDVITTASGYEQRNINWKYPRYKYDLTVELCTVEDLNTMVAFFRLHQGRAVPFRFRDWTDYRVDNQLVSLAEGDRKSYQLLKRYYVDGLTDQRLITKPIPETVVVNVGGVVVPCGVDYDTGIITLEEPVPYGSEIRASFEFDVLLRFDMDHLDIRSIDAAQSVVNITFIEVREPQYGRR